jgi:class 3 adenylate cyclase
MRTAPVTLLFTDLVSSTELLQRAGDEQAQRIFQAHHRLLKRCVEAHGGQEVKWLGDGLMTVFASPADAVRCAVAMQQSARRRAAGERLSIRVGLNVGEVRRDESDYFGIPVVIARRLCDRAQAGQILCSALVSGLLVGQPAFTFGDCGPVEVTGLNTPVSACQVLYQQDQPTALLTHTPFVGRVIELARLTAKLRDTHGGHGGLAMLAGEPGIGKTRTLEEFAETARSEGALVLWGRCYDGEAARPYGPFVEVVAEYARGAAAAALQDDLGVGAAPLARLVPVLRERLPDIPEPAPLQPDEARVRLLDAVVQLLLALAARAPLVLVLDDLHWADGATIALLRHVARFAPQHRLLLLGAYRDVEVGAQHPLWDALGALPRETSYEHLGLSGLNSAEVEQLLEAVADHQVADALVAPIVAETSGNPFFIREVLLHLAEEGQIVWRESGWTAQLATQPVGIPQSVRQVIQRRLAHLPERANRLLRSAAGFAANFPFCVVARVAGLEETEALDAIDDALAAQLLCSGDQSETFDFTHALVRHALYAELSPPRQIRLHRQIAEMMEQIYGDRAAEHAAELAYQYSRSAALPGSERGVPHAVAAADQAESAYAHDDAVIFLRMALQLLPPDDARRARILGRLGMALSAALNFDEALPAMREAGELIVAAEGEDAAADYLAEAATGLWGAGSQRGAWALASQGLGYIRDRRDLTWVRLMANDIMRREAEDPEYPGIARDTPERSAVLEITERLSFSRPEEIYLGARGFLAAARSRKDILGRLTGNPFWLVYGAGEYRRSLPLWEDLEAQSQREGRIADAVVCAGQLACCHNALGNAAAARTAYDRGAALADRLTSSVQTTSLTAARYQMQTVVGEGWEDFLREEETSQRLPTTEETWMLGAMQATAVHLFARLGRTGDSLFLLATLLPALERASGLAFGYAVMATEAATALWLLQRTDHIEVIERNLHDKILVPDFRWPMADARLSMAHLAALQGRCDEAAGWFAQARAVLDEQGARPLRAIVDVDEAVMYHRRDTHGDAERAQPLLNAALAQFHALGMTGWIRRAEALQAPCTPATSAADRAIEPQQSATLAASASPTVTADTMHAPSAAVLHQEGDYWTLTYGGRIGRMRDTKGLHYLAHLLRHPGQEFHALDLVQGTGSRAQGTGSEKQKPRTRNDEPEARNQGLEMLDATAKAAYKRRLAELRDELEEAEQFNDSGRGERAREEIEAITEQLAAAVGLGGRNRVAGGAAERARSTVTKRLKDAIDKIAVTTPDLADHLSGRVRTGTFCLYVPDAARPIEWEL